MISLTVDGREVLWRDPALFGAGPDGAGSFGAGPGGSGPNGSGSDGSVPDEVGPDETGQDGWGPDGAGPSRAEPLDPGWCGAGPLDPDWSGARPLDPRLVPRADARPGPDGWLNWGGEKTWPAPQGWDGAGQWPGPPDDVIDGGAHAVVSASPDRVALVSGDDPATGLRAEREIRLEDDGVVITGAVRNVSAEPRRWAAWSVAQLPFGPADVASDVAGVAVSGCGAPRALLASVGAVAWDERDDGIRVRFADVVGKLGFPVSAAAVVRAEATWADGFRAAMSFEVPDADHPDGSPFQLWMQTEVDGALPGLGDMTAGARYVELEALSPLRELAPGEAVGVVVRWSFPG